MIYGLIIIWTKSKKMIREIKIGQNLIRQIIIMRENIIMSINNFTFIILRSVKGLVNKF